MSVSAAMCGNARNTATFSLASGAYSNGNTTSATIATYTITCSTACIWSYQLGSAVTCNVANNASASSITFTLNQGSVNRTQTTLVAATLAGFASYSITLSTTGAGGEVSVVTL